MPVAITEHVYLWFDNHA